MARAAAERRPLTARERLELGLPPPKKEPIPTLAPKPPGRPSGNAEWARMNRGRGDPPEPVEETSSEMVACKACKGSHPFVVTTCPVLGRSVDGT